jgi:hypothetical protein
MYGCMDVVVERSGLLILALRSGVLLRGSVHAKQPPLVTLEAVPALCSSESLLRFFFLRYVETVYLLPIDDCSSKQRFQQAISTTPVFH